MKGWRWWRDCRLLRINHWTAYASRTGDTDADGYLFRCSECGWRWGR